MSKPASEKHLKPCGVVGLPQGFRCLLALPQPRTRKVLSIYFYAFLDSLEAV